MAPFQRAYILMLEQFRDSKEQVGSLPRTPRLSTIQQTLPHGELHAHNNWVRADGSTFYLCEDDATFLRLDWGGIEGTRILEHLRLVQVEQRTAVLVLLVKVHCLQHSSLGAGIKGKLVEADGRGMKETADVVLMMMMVTLREKSRTWHGART